MFERISKLIVILSLFLSFGLLVPNPCAIANTPVIVNESLESPSFSVPAPTKKDLQPIFDSLNLELSARLKVYLKSQLNLKEIRTRSGKTSLYFNETLSYYPWRSESVSWFRLRVKELIPGLNVTNIYSNGYELSELILPPYSRDGKPNQYSLSIKDPNADKDLFIERLDQPQWSHGLSGRNIVLWQSHGRYFNENQGVWTWQRVSMHRTTEDMFTQSFVLPYLIPMLENSGAYTMTPRERDLNEDEYICDNDKAFPDKRDLPLRREGKYIENGKWTKIEPGFKDYLKEYTFSDNPFRAGTARIAACAGEGKKASARARWTPNIEKQGQYAVYVAYKSLKNSSPKAHYTVHHAGGVSEFFVDQRKGGGTWIYLGTFEFESGSNSYIDLDNRGEKRKVVCADAVKIGGGVGKLSRGGRVSGVRSAYEGAHYWMQWAGVDESITQNWENDYNNDYATRGLWTKMLRDSLDIPIDLSLAFHSDAGVSCADSTIGTLAIYTLKEDGKRKLKDGRDRVVNRLLCDYVQSSIVNDVRAEFDTTWTRRGLWDRNYSESRTTGVPGMILELLSHQNFSDMKYGLDPAFKFTVCRAVYKGILKTLAAYYDCEYMVQPLPVNSFAAKIAGSEIQLSWKPTIDANEPTAVSEGYIVYQRLDDGSFDMGTYIDDSNFVVELKPGHIQSFKIEAYNRGGKSFPSEILSVGWPLDAQKEIVLVVNNFDKVSAPSWVENGDYAGFTDSGVPYIRDISYVGDVYDFDRKSEYIDDYAPGHGASTNDRAGEIIAGNSFDYPYLHGKSLFELGYPFYSMSKKAFCEKGDSVAFALDLICGKQSTTVLGHGNVPNRYTVFTEDLQSSIKSFAARGGHIFVSGSRIASDDTTGFVSKAFGYAFANKKATSKDYLVPIDTLTLGDKLVEFPSLETKFHYYNSPNSLSYCVEEVDGLKKANAKAHIWLRFEGSNHAAGINFINGESKSVSMTVPLETLCSEEERKAILRSALYYFRKEGSQMLVK